MFGTNAGSVLAQRLVRLELIGFVNLLSYYVDLLLYIFSMRSSVVSITQF